MTLYSLLLILILLVTITYSADLAIEIPGNLSQRESWYRLDYSPPVGYPPPNTTIAATDIGDVIKFQNGLPGTKYEFWLYYSNGTLHDWLTWTASITTAPDPPSNLTILVRNGKTAIVYWAPPSQGNYTSFRIRVQSFNDASNPPSTTRTSVIQPDNIPYTLRDLIPGATYSLQLFTVLDAKESVAYTSRNFTTKPNTPGKFIVWFRNETTLLVLWQPPYPAGIYTHYKVSIEPPDAIESVFYVEKEGEPPGPAQAAFKDLVPGRAYNISVQTVSEDETSAPTTAQYRTVPLRPLNVTFDKASITSSSFRVYWSPPNGTSEFDKYQVSLGSNRRFSPVTRNRYEENSNIWKFKDLEAGKTYQVVVKTVSGKVTSWPASGDITLKPLPVRDLRASIDDRMLEVSWKPDNTSTQDSYRLEYHEVDSITSISGDSNSLTTEKTNVILEALLPGRNYTIIVQAISNKVESNETIIYQVTKPSSPIIEDLKSIERGLNISWKSDVNSRQEKFEITHTRNDTGESATTLTTESHIILEDLYPGAGYEVKVFAISHGLKSEPHDYFQAVLPHPPQHLRINKVNNNNSVFVHWSPPINSLFSEYTIRYRTEDDSRWIKLPSVKETEAEVTDMTPGEKYTIQVNTISFGVESLYPLQVNHTIPPNPVVNITPVVDSTNVTLEFWRPEGRIELFIITWWPVDNPSDWRSKNVSGIINVDDEDEEFFAEEENKLERFIIESLMPGVKYGFSISTTSYNLYSDLINITARTMPLIQSEVVIVVDRDLPDSLTLRYTRTPIQSSRFDLYRFRISDKENTTKEKLRDDADTKVTFNNLTPGKLYNVTVWTVSQGIQSRPLFRQDRLYPEAITEISALDINDTSITLTWDVPDGEFDAFEVQYINSDGGYSQNITLINRITISDLKPHRNYTFTLVVCSGHSESHHLRRSHPVSASFTTSESYPGKVEKFYPTDIQPSEISFEWFLPSTEFNGIIKKFTITYGLDGSTHTQVKDFKSNELRGVIKGLVPGKAYLFRIQAETRVGFGPETIWKQKMPILAPPKPPTQVVPTEVCRSSTTIQIRFRKNYFSEQHGAVTSYTIIVAEDHSKNASGLEMPSWRDVQAYSIWPPYQVMEPYYPFKNSSVEDFTIGSDNCEKVVGYCNGPLKSGSTYRVKVRAFTAPDKFTDTSYSFPIQTDKDNTAIIVGITVPIVLLLTLLGIGLLVRRHRNQLRKITEPRGNGPTDNLSLPDSVIETNRPIRVENFAEHYRIMSADSDFRFSEEFEELKHVGRDQPCTAADLPCNRPKNRFTNILPYDHSRFKLQPVDDEEGSDYINANYVPGHNSPREFIVTQGPLHSTRDDFWRMVWESNSRAIVMLTRCIEKGREKCDHYWPMDTLPVYYGDICVTILNETRYPDWSIMEFMLCRGDVKRVIQHFHFTTWPDFGVPSPPQTLARFVRAFRERVRPDQRPIVVHCSAGVGRSGTFITLDRILQQIQVSDYVDIFGIVWTMRKERVWMVQTEQQYICIHQCLLAVLEGQQDTTGPPREIHDNQGFEGKNQSSPENSINQDEEER
ncbi:tyrosine-protein phosphatase 10D isoform X2 [Chelonus insularis]|uniref:tyrosine-protein phosphatase 10D isoform X2 n=1 Tax=Chelonus insularis TaxID=460826 RepID=UPI0015888938|nr:tyrosine-protein phosphatase 10D isoform X2 [Chelonus insularis]